MDSIRNIKYLEEIARTLEPQKPARKHLWEAVIRYGENFLDKLGSLKTYREDKEKGKPLLDEEFEEKPQDIGHILKMIEKYVNTPGLNPASGGHLGYIPGGGIYPAALGDYLAAVTNRYAGVFFAGPGAVRIENKLIHWMRDLVGFPDTTLGHIASGGSIANLTGIVCARDAFELKGKDFERVVVYVTQQVHHSVDKALRISGLGEAVKRFIPMDNAFRMDASCLRDQIAKDRKAGLKPWLVVAAAGTTDTGAVDPLDELGEITRKEDLWLHVDGAYGAFFMLCEQGKKALKGIEKADSLVMDPHKGLFLPYGSGVILVRNGGYLQRSHYYLAHYMQDAKDYDEEVSPAEISPELSKHFRGLRIWFPLKVFGLNPFRAALEEKICLARYFYETIRLWDHAEVGPFPELSVVLFRFLPPDRPADQFNKDLIDAVKKDGRVFLSSTQINGHFYLRLAVLSFRTHLNTIDLTLSILKESIYRLKSTR